MTAFRPKVPLLLVGSCSLFSVDFDLCAVDRHALPLATVQCRTRRTIYNHPVAIGKIFPATFGLDGIWTVAQLPNRSNIHFQPIKTLKLFWKVVFSELFLTKKHGKVPEWLNGLAWKASVPSRVPGVRIPLFPHGKVASNIRGDFLFFTAEILARLAGFFYSIRRGSQHFSPIRFRQIHERFASHARLAFSGFA